MLRRSIVFGMLAASALASGCVTNSEPTVQKNFDATVDFAAYKSYRIFQEPLIALDEDRPSQNVVDMVGQSLEATLARKGFVLVADDAPADFAVGFTVGVARTISKISLPVNYEEALTGQWSSLYFEDRKVIDREGILAIHVFDVATKRAAYSTTGAKRLPSNYDRNDVSKIPEATEILLADFPPQQ